MSENPVNVSTTKNDDIVKFLRYIQLKVKVFVCVYVALS